MSLKSITASITAISLTSIAFGLSLMTPVKANASSLYQENFSAIGINAEPFGLGQSLNMNQINW